jgi:Holliday junction resolvasome RuvABC DNA-binding subunit
LEFDHIEPVARGGKATVGTMRLRCRAHNQHEAERLFGAGFMNRKREEAKQVRDEARTRDIESCLRRLGFRAEEVRRAAARASALEGATLEDSIREALRTVAPRAVRAPS